MRLSEIRSGFFVRAYESPPVTSMGHSLWARIVPPPVLKAFGLSRTGGINPRHAVSIVTVLSRHFVARSLLAYPSWAAALVSGHLFVVEYRTGA